MSARGERRRLVLRGVAGPIALGRDFTRRTLHDWRRAADVDADSDTGEDASAQQVADNVVLIVSELLSNATLHAGGPRELILEADAETLRVEVVDGDPTVPAPGSPRYFSSPGGFGLNIVERLSSRWGVDSRDDGKAVWAEIGFPQAGNAAAG